MHLGFVGSLAGAYGARCVVCVLLLRSTLGACRKDNREGKKS